MKVKNILNGIVILLAFVCITVLSQNFIPTRDRIVISGEVLRIGEIPTDMSKWRFRLVQYRVLNICEGDYTEKEIIVSQFPEELKNAKVGMKVCSVVTKSEGPNINPDWSIDFSGKDTHYTTDGLLINNCECHK